jgi:hypothetical protein
VHFPLRKSLFGRARQIVKAVDGVSLEILEGETLGLVGESGAARRRWARDTPSGRTDVRPVMFAARTCASPASAMRAQRGISRLFSGPVCVTQPAHDGQSNYQRAPRDISSGARTRAHASRAGADAAGRPKSPFLKTVSARILWRAATTHRDSRAPCQSIRSSSLLMNRYQALDVSIQSQIMNLPGSAEAREEPHVSFHLTRSARSAARL